jgi:hypothetical protein
MNNSFINIQSFLRCSTSTYAFAFHFSRSYLPFEKRIYSAYIFFRSNADEICALLGYYAALSGNSVPTFRDNLSVPSSRTGPTDCTETSVQNYHTVLCNIPEQRISRIY